MTLRSGLLIFTAIGALGLADSALAQNTMGSGAMSPGMSMGSGAAQESAMETGSMKSDSMKSSKTSAHKKASAPMKRGSSKAPMNNTMGDSMGSVPGSASQGGPH